MFTDMVGYTALGQKDESLSLAVVEAQQRLLRPVLARHRGREVKTMGDAFLVEFASAVEAVRCAYDIQRSVREFNLALSSEKRMHIRIGIHVGEVVEKGGDIYSDAVNVASRIQPIADDGGVCLTQQVYDQVKNKLEFPLESLGSKFLKNVSAPLEVYRMVMPWSEEKVIPQPQLNRNRIAILPFVNMSPDPADDYFSDGMTEEMISALSKVRGLEVISRTSVMQYKNKPKGMIDIGRELNVGTLMEGSVRKAGSKVRITVQLIEAGSDKHLWVDNFDRNLEDIFKVQSDVAEKVASSLQIRLMTEDKKRIEKGGTPNVEAHTLYLRGRVNLWRQDAGSLRAAVDCFERALQLDPSYALACCGLSRAYSFMAVLEMVEPKEAYQKAELYARKALDLDGTLAEAHAALDGPLMSRYDFKGAESELRRAIEVNPNLSEAFFWLPGLCELGGRRGDAMKAIEQELRLDPFSVQTSGSVGSWYLLCGEYDKAVKHLKDAVELDRNASLYLNNLGLAHILVGLKDEGLGEAKRAWELGFRSASDLALAFVMAGKSEEARRLIAEFEKPGEGKHVPSTSVAGAYAVLGEKEKALEWLERAYEERGGYLPWTKLDLAFENVWKEPRYLTLLEKMGLR